MKVYFTSFLVFCFLFTSFAQDSWVNYYSIDFASSLEATPDGGFFIYPRNTETRIKINAQGDSLYTEPFKFPKRNSLYSYSNSVLTKTDTLGNEIWSKPAGFHENVGLYITSSEIAYVYYNHPNISSGYALMTVFDQDGNIKFDTTLNTGLRDRIRFFESKFDGSAIISFSSSTSNQPQGGNSSGGPSFLFDRNGDIQCEVKENQILYFPSTRMVNMAQIPDDTCKAIIYWKPGVINPDPNAIEGYRLPCVNTVISEFIGGEPRQMVGLSDGGYAFLGWENDKVTLTRVYCGSTPPHRSPTKVTIYADVDQNCIRNNLDTPLVNFPIQIGDETYYTNEQGRISESLIANTYSIGLDTTLNNNWIPCQSIVDSISLYAGSEPISLLFRNNETSTTKAITHQKNIKIYPNPVLDNLQIEFYSQHSGIVNYSVFNSVGTKIFDGKKLASFGENQFDINFENTPKGVYYLKFYEANSETGCSISKFIKI